MPIVASTTALAHYDTAYAHWDRTALEPKMPADAPVSLLVKLLPEPSGGAAGGQAKALKALIEGPGPVKAQDGERERLAWLIACGEADEAEVFVRVPQSALAQAIADNASLFTPLEWMAQAGPKPAEAPAAHVADPLIDATSKPARDLRTALAQGTLPSGVTLRRQAIMAVIDGDMGYLNARFTTEAVDGKRLSRIERIWLQGIAEEDRQSEVFDRVHTKSDLNSALAQLAAGQATEASLYRQMRPLGGDTRVFPQQAGHGTHVMDLACGADPALNPDLPIFAVQLASAALADPSSRRLDGAFVQGIRWLIRSALAWVAAQNRAALTAHGKGEAAEFLVPDIILNASIGTLAGPKNGMGLVERLVAAELELVNDLSAPVTKWVAAGYRATLFQSFGNAYRTEQVGLMKGVTGKAPEIEWRLPRNDWKSSVLEMRLEDADLDTLSLTGPDGAVYDLSAPAEGAWVDVQEAGAVLLRLYRGRDEGDAGRRVYRLFARPTERPGRPAFVCAQSGVWTLALKVAAKTDIGLAVQRDDTPFGYVNMGGQSTLSETSCRGWETSRRGYSAPQPGSIVSRMGTETAEANGADLAVVTVGATVASVGGPAPYSASGSDQPILTSRPGPVASARGDETPTIRGVLAAGTYSGSAVRLAGTSVAAPLAARKMAETGDRPEPPAPPDPRLGTLSEAASALRDTRRWP